MPSSQPNPQQTFFENRKEGAGIWKWRHYFDIYDRHFNRFRGRDVAVVERTNQPVAELVSPMHGTEWQPFLKVRPPLTPADESGRPQLLGWRRRAVNPGSA